MLPKLSVFKNASTVTPLAEASVENIVKRIRSDKYRPQTDTLRSLKDPNTPREYIASNFFGVTWSGTFAPTRTASNLQTHSSLICIDLDELSTDRLATLTNQLCADPFTHVLFVSASGAGLNVVIRIDRQNQEDHSAFFQQVGDYYRDCYGVTDTELDVSGKHVDDLCVLPCDPDAYYNPHSEVMPLADEYTVISALNPEQGELSSLTNPDPGEEFDLNIPESTLSQTQDTGQWDNRRFSGQVFSDLPDSLKAAAAALTTPTEREVFLVGALGVISGILPNVGGLYDGENYGPNLYTYTVAPYGQGKGALKYARQLGAAIHRKKREEYERLQQEHEAKKVQYEYDRKAFQQDKKGVTAPPPVPSPPGKLMLFVPGNSSKTVLIEVLKQNNSRLTVFEAEGDTLADALKQEHGNYSDVLRNAFQHEPVGYLRRSNGGEFVEVERPQVSVVLSSTFDQLQTLMPTAKNGLFSRFLYYQLVPDNTFRKVFDPKKETYSAVFEKAGETFRKIYDRLNSYTEPIMFCLTTEQQNRFYEVFQAEKNDAYSAEGDLGGTINRMALIAFRVAMILTTVRAFGVSGDGNVGSRLVCSDADFDNTLRIIDVLKRHAYSVYYQLPQPRRNSPVDAEDADVQKAEQKRQCRELHAQGMSVRQIALQVLGNENKKSTVHRWINP